MLLLVKDLVMSMMVKIGQAFKTEFKFLVTSNHFQDGEISTEEFMKGIEMSCKGKAFADLPTAFKFFIDAQFRTIDVDGEID